MSENTANAGHEPINICFGMMEPDEKGNITMPPEYSHRMSLKGDEAIIIPLESNSKRKTTKTPNKDSKKTTSERVQ